MDNYVHTSIALCFTILYCCILSDCVDMAFCILVHLLAASVGDSASLYYKYLNAQYVSAQLATFRSRIWCAAVSR
jgi:hypothetical protein